MLEKLQALEKMISAMIKTELNLKEDIFTNKIIETWTDGAAEGTEILDEAAMRARAKQGTMGTLAVEPRRSSRQHPPRRSRCSPACRPGCRQRKRRKNWRGEASRRSSLRRPSATTSSNGSRVLPWSCTRAASLASTWGADPPTLSYKTSRWSSAALSCLMYGLPPSSSEPRGPPVRRAP